MTTNPNLSRIRRGASGIFVAATVAVDGLAAELAVPAGTIGHAATPVGAVERVAVDVRMADPYRRRRELARAAAVVRARLDELDRAASRFRADSELAVINSRSAGAHPALDLGVGLGLPEGRADRLRLRRRSGCGARPR
ncbi:hypothetical protein [Nocardia nova]|uniref:hypothetical protein n=1 Tax=Nocardia nova TaxID=37330 RepID=UPI0015E38FED|nr:hypothetical protein [Nocardia nova]